MGGYAVQQPVAVGGYGGGYGGGSDKSGMFGGFSSGFQPQRFGANGGW